MVTTGIHRSGGQLGHQGSSPFHHLVGTEGPSTPGGGPGQAVHNGRGGDHAGRPGHPGGPHRPRVGGVPGRQRGVHPVRQRGEGTGPPGGLRQLRRRRYAGLRRWPQPGRPTRIGGRPIGAGRGRGPEGLGRTARRSGGRRLRGVHQGHGLHFQGRAGAQRGDPRFSGHGPGLPPPRHRRGLRRRRRRPPSSWGAIRTKRRTPWESPRPMPPAPGPSPSSSWDTWSREPWAGVV